MIAVQTIELGPQPGPQNDFSGCSADICIYGGSAGCGKSRMLVHEPTRHYKVKGFTGAIFRKTGPELTGPGSVWEDARGIYPLLGGRMRENKMDCRFPNGALIQFAHCQYEDDLTKQQSKSYCYIAIDELAEKWSEREFWFILGRNRSLCGVRPYFRAGCNPKFESFVRVLIDWWIDENGFPIPERSGVIRWLARGLDEELIWADSEEELQKIIDEKYPDEDPKDRPRPYSFTFIAATLDDNPLMEEKDPGYRARLMLLNRIDRERMLKGNWNIRAAAGELFKTHWFEIVDAAPAKVVKRVRFWDKAGTEKKTKGDVQKASDPAFTVGALWSKTEAGLFYVEDIVRLQGRPHAVETAIENTAKLDGKSVEVCIWQDPGQAGKADIDNFVRLLAGWKVYGIPAREDKVSYAKPVSAQAERENIKLVRGPWNKGWLAEHEGFPELKLKDQVDSSSGALLRLTSKPIYFA